MTFAGLTGSQLLTLFGSLGVAVALLYVLKLRRKHIEVPFAPLWARVVEERQSTSLFKRLQRLFSLLVQLCILAAVVLALGDPKISGMAGCDYQPPKPPPTRHTVFLLDASASMSAIEGGQSRVARARQRAHELIDALGDNPNHRGMVLQFDAKVRPLSLWTADRKTLHQAVDNFASTGALDTATRVTDALAFAATAIKGRADAQVVMVTDRGFSPIKEPQVRALNLQVEAIGRAGSNVSLKSFNVRPYLDDSLNYAIFYAIKNEADRPLKATLFLYANADGRSIADFSERGNIVASYSLTLPARGVLSNVIDDVSFAGARLMAKVEIAAEEPVRDLLPRDDVAFAIVPERKKLRVQLVSKGNSFLHATLFVRENVDFELVAPAAYRGPEGFDVTIVDSVNVDMSKPGAYFIIDPQPSNGVFDIADGLVEEPDVKRLNGRHPIARNLKLVDLNIGAMRSVKKRRGDKVVAAAKGGAPVLLTRTDASSGRKFVVLSFDIRDSLLPLNYAFPLLIVNVLNWFYAEDDALLTPNRAGDVVNVASTLEGDRSAPLRVKGPHEGALSSARRIDDRLLFSTDRIGVYEFSTAQAKAPMPVAINLMDEGESSALPQGEYAAFKAPPKWEKPTDPWMENLWRALLLGALALLVLEWLTYNRRMTV